MLLTTLSNFKVGTRLATAFSLLVGASLALALFGADRLQAVNARTSFILDDAYAQVRNAQQVHRGVSLQARMLTNSLIEIGDSEAAAAMARAAKADADAAVAMKALDAGIRDAASREAFTAAVAARTKYASAVATVIKLVADGNTTSGRQTLLDDVIPPLNTYLAALDRLADMQTAGMERAALQARSTGHAATVGMLASGGIVALLAAIAAVLITRSITRPIDRALGLTSAVARGDLTTEIGVTGRDELGQLLQALGAMNASLATMVRNVREGSDHIAVGSAEIANGNADLSQRTEQQAASLQHTSSSLSELAAAVQRGAVTSQDANDRASRAAEAATNGSNVVCQVVATMDEIAGSSRRIADITSEVDGIAFQTNILALNAAVEAARAGEQGRGFAVVATEVRNLAKRAASAAREIKALTGESNQRVEAGTQLVRSAGREMNDIERQVRQVSVLISELSSGAADQTGRIGAVSEAVNQLDQVTQQNSALVEQSAAATESLRDQATMLTRLVGAFRVV